MELSLEDKTRLSKHQKDLFSFPPVLARDTSDEMWISFAEWSRRHPDKEPKGLYQLEHEFHEWCSGLEKNTKIWIENLESGKDEYRDKHLHPRIQQKIQAIGHGRCILDIGCGTGDAVVPHLKDSQHYFGMDLSRGCLEYLSKKYRVPILNRLNDHPESTGRKMVGLAALPASIPFNDYSHFDELICSMVLHHVRDLSTSLDSMLNLIVPGGNYFIVVFDPAKRKERDGLFERITYRDAQRTIGDYRLPHGLMRDVEINFHSNKAMLAELEKYSNFIRTENIGGIFKLYEGIKCRKK